MLVTNNGAIKHQYNRGVKYVFKKSWGGIMWEGVSCGVGVGGGWGVPGRARWVSFGVWSFLPLFPPRRGGACRAWGSGACAGGLLWKDMNVAVLEHWPFDRVIFPTSRM
ncbi:hypothetical protein DPMN_014544 [Dreissena polymorpha]|uniref:Uncharacterized protein n=1 Tax=Dreissena polymorpha TaxID=45954 RepID=A0A9D4N673_DREPO|nr:hypothetical protein DPMN_014544 [Dreissena polymorpha]